jgi:flagellar hook-associated protein 1 FlgK
MLNTINVASSGLAASREQVENVMNNIANENTPGYKKRVTNIAEASHVDARLTGRGVEVGDTTRVTNIYLYDNLTQEKSKESQYDELSMMLADIEAIFHETDDSGFSADLDRYFQALENLRSNPNNEIYKDDLRNTGIAVVDDLKTLYSDIESREKVAFNTLNDDIQELNSILNDIGNINETMAQQLNISNDLLDKRDQLEQRMAEYIDLNVHRDTNYELEIGGMTAVRFDTNIHEVNVIEEYTAQKDIYATYNSGSGKYESDIINNATWTDDNDDFITYKLNNEFSITVTHGEVVNGEVVDKDNIIKALVYKINNNPDLNAVVTAYNGQYITDSSGNRILTSDTAHSDYDASNPDRYLIIEANIEGDKGKFEGRLIVEDSNSVSEASINDSISKKGADDVHLEIFDKELTLKSGKLDPILDNLTTESGANYFTKYKEQLDNIARTLSDISQSYIENSDGTYVYGESNVEIDANRANKVEIGLFSGGTVNTLQFNDGKVAGLTQDKLDYLASIQWKEDIDIDGTGGDLTSFSKYNQALRVEIAADKENIDFKAETQSAVTESLQTTYDKMVKVDKDEEMMNLIKFQAAYEANAKIITLLDEMLATILGMTR